MDAVFLQFPFTFVGQQDNRFAALADQPGKKFVIGLNAVSRIEQKQTDVGFFDCAFGLLPHSFFQTIVLGIFKSGRVNNLQIYVAQLGLCFLAVARHAGLVVYNGYFASGQPVKQC